jgi:hypothetical protein
MYNHSNDLREFRIDAMIDPKSEAYWHLNDEDRAALLWLKEQIIKARDDGYRYRQESIDSMKRVTEIREKVEAVVVPLLKAVQST